MIFFQWINAVIKRFDYFDIVLIKLGTVAFTLMVAKLWDTILNLNWYSYGILFLILAIRPWFKVFVTGNSK